MFFPDRRRRGPDRYLREKAAGLVIGALFVLVGGQLAQDWLVWSGISVLGLAVLLRFLPQRAPNDGENDG